MSLLKIILQYQKVSDITFLKHLASWTEIAIKIQFLMHA